MNLHTETKKDMFFLDGILHPVDLIYNKRNETIRNWCQPSPGNGFRLNPLQMAGSCETKGVCVCICVFAHACSGLKLNLTTGGCYKHTDRETHTHLKVLSAFMLNLDLAVEELVVLAQTDLHTHTLTTELDLTPILQM